MNNSNRIFSILAIGDVDSGKNSVIKYLTGGSENISSDNFRMCNNENLPLIKLFNFDVNFEDTKQFVEDLSQLLFKLKDGVNLILIFIPLNIMRIRVSYLSQIYRLLGGDIFNNLVVVFTNSEILNEKYSNEVLENYMRDLPEVMIENLMIVNKDNFIKFEPFEFGNFIIQKLKTFTIYNLPICENFMKIYEKNSDLVYSLILTYQVNSNFQRFVKNQPTLLEYFKNYQKKDEVSLKRKSNSRLFYILSLISAGISAYYLSKNENENFNCLINLLKEKIFKK